MSGWDGYRHLASEIAHELLHLYGAIDLLPEKLRVDPPELMQRIKENVDTTDVMYLPQQADLSTLTVSDLTAYLVGWAGPPKWLYSGSR
jgi:hypothetical protein